MISNIRTADGLSIVQWAAVVGYDVRVRDLAMLNKELGLRLWRTWPTGRLKLVPKD